MIVNAAMITIALVFAVATYWITYNRVESFTNHINFDDLRWFVHHKGRASRKHAELLAEAMVIYQFAHGQERYQWTIK